MRLIPSPLLPGFHPDPCILRVGDDYYIATSTFEWWPGVRVFHSRDLIHWRLAASPLRTSAHCDLTGVPSSGGIWAPGLSHSRGQFHLVFTRVTRADHAAGRLELQNYHVQAETISGPWSSAAPLNTSGFDPSLFHDDDGRSWLVNMIWKNDAPPHFAGIALQEFDCSTRRLLGEPVEIFRGTPLGSTEGPHLYKREGHYYLITAEGGTSYGHAVTVARSRSLTGPFDLHPDNPILTSADDPALPIQKAGHGSLVETPHGEWYLAHLGARPLRPLGNCPLGRETFLQKVLWHDDGWPRLTHGGRHPAADVPAPALALHPWPRADNNEFTGTELSLEWNSRREAIAESWASLKARPGWLRLIGRNRLSAREGVSLVARRLTATRADVEVTLEVPSQTGDFEAGIAVIYDDENWTWFGLQGTAGSAPRIVSVSRRRGHETSVDYNAASGRTLRLAVEFESGLFILKAGEAGGAPNACATFDLGELSDEACGSSNVPAFTGCFIGLYAAGSTGFFADFADWVNRTS